MRFIRYMLLKAALNPLSVMVDAVHDRLKAEYFSQNEQHAFYCTPYIVHFDRTVYTGQSV